MANTTQITHLDAAAAGKLFGWRGKTGHILTHKQHIHINNVIRMSSPRSVNEIGHVFVVELISGASY